MVLPSSLQAQLQNNEMVGRGATVGCAACMWWCKTVVHNHLLHDFRRHGVGAFMHRLHFEPFHALPTCNFVYVRKQLVWTFYQCASPLCDTTLCKTETARDVPCLPSLWCPNK